MYVYIIYLAVVICMFSVVKTKTKQNKQKNRENNNNKRNKKTNKQNTHKKQGDGIHSITVTVCLRVYFSHIFSLKNSEWRLVVWTIL